mgnify:FL=1|jgi:hypothetical protein
MNRKITLTIDEVGHKQWATLILELNSMCKAWRRFGVKIKITAPKSDKIIRWGNKRNDERDIRPEIRT